MVNRIFCLTILLLTLITEIILSQTTSQNVNILLSNITNPCDSFYQYACREWEVNNPIPDNVMEMNTFIKAQRNIDNYFYDIIANSSYASNDSRLFAAHEFYKACIKIPFDSIDHVKNQMLQLITKAFGHWDLMTSFNGNWENRSDAVKNVLNLSLTDVYLPLISATGHSPLFSLEVDAETNIIRIGFRELKQMFYRAVEFLNLNRSNNESFNEAFELFDRLASIDWDYLFTKLFDQNGLTTYNRRQIEIADTFLLQYRCGLHKIQLETDAGKRSQPDIPTYLSEAFNVRELNSIYIFGGLMQTPFYEKNENQFLKFTGLGWIIAHEFLHAIDITGILIDENGHLRTSGNSETGLIANIKQADCLRLHYKLHPGAYGKTFCGHVRAGSYAHYQNNVHHLFPEFRVFGALSNSEEFAEAYNCSTDSPMNPSNKCKLW
ncbi:unnamed protein product [Schistosoma turkestanicum]|nr:unnamed protein product [Schistosoma turkestanicum]